MLMPHAAGAVSVCFCSASPGEKQDSSASRTGQQRLKDRKGFLVLKTAPQGQEGLSCSKNSFLNLSEPFCAAIIYPNVYGIDMPNVSELVAHGRDEAGVSAPTHHPRRRNIRIIHTAVW